MAIYSIPSDEQESELYYIDTIKHRIAAEFDRKTVQILGTREAIKQPHQELGIYMAISLFVRFVHMHLALINI